MVYSELLQASKKLQADFPWIAAAKFFDKVDSTQKRIVTFLPKETDRAVIVIAETQSRGIGRFEKPWLSPSGGIWFTLGFPMRNLPLEKASSFSLVAGVVAADSIMTINNLECKIKWPNDIICQGKKLGGILVTTTTKFKNNWMLVGVGINVNNEISKELPGAISIKLVRGQSQGRTRLIESIVGNLWTAWQDYEKTGFGPYHASCQSRLEGLQNVVKIKSGTSVIEGKLRGVDVSGGLLIDADGGQKVIHAGEILN